MYIVLTVTKLSVVEVVNLFENHSPIFLCNNGNVTQVGTDVKRATDIFFLADRKNKLVKKLEIFNLKLVASQEIY